MAGDASLLGLPAELKGAVLEYVSDRAAEHQATFEKANDCLAHLLQRQEEYLSRLQRATSCRDALSVPRHGDHHSSVDQLLLLNDHRLRSGMDASYTC